MRVIRADPTYVLQTVEMIKGLIISVIGVLVISRIVVDIWPFHTGTSWSKICRGV